MDAGGVSKAVIKQGRVKKRGSRETDDFIERWVILSHERLGYTFKGANSRVVGFIPLHAIMRVEPVTDNPSNVELAGDFVVYAKQIVKGQCDPYVTIQVGDEGTTHKTKVKKKRTGPWFGESFIIPTTGNGTLIVKCFDWDRIGDDDLIGSCKVPLGLLLSNGGARFEDFLLTPDDAVSAADDMSVCLSIEQLEEEAGAPTRMSADSVSLVRASRSPPPRMPSNTSTASGVPASPALNRRSPRMLAQAPSFAQSFRQSFKRSSGVAPPVHLRVTVHSARSLPDMDGLMHRSAVPDSPIRRLPTGSPGFSLHSKLGAPPSSTDSPRKLESRFFGEEPGVGAGIGTGGAGGGLLARHISARVGSPRSSSRAAGMVRKKSMAALSLSSAGGRGSAHAPILPPKFVDFHLRAPDQAGRDRWIRAIRRAVERAEPEEDEVDGLKGAQLAVKAFYDHGWVVALFSYGILLGLVFDLARFQFLDADADEGTSKARLFRAIDVAFSSFFLLDLLLNLFSHWFSAFVEERKNLVDFAIVIVSFWGSILPHSGLPSQIRAFRVIRLTRKFASMAKILYAVSASVKPILEAFVMVLLFTTAYAIVSVPILGDAYPDFFGTTFLAMLTLFQVCTGDAWVSQIVRNIVLRLPVTTDGSNPTEEDFATWEQRGIGTATAHIFSPIFFLSYVLFITMILFNVVIAIIIEEFGGAGRRISAELAQARLKRALARTPPQPLDGLVATFEGSDAIAVEERLRKTFHAIDEDGSGTMTMVELQEGLQKLPVRPRILLSDEDFDRITLDRTLCEEDEGLSIDGWLELARACREDYKSRKHAGGMKHVGLGQDDYDDDDEDEEEEGGEDVEKQLEEIRAKVLRQCQAIFDEKLAAFCAEMTQLVRDEGSDLDPGLLEPDLASGWARTNGAARQACLQDSDAGEEARGRAIDSNADRDEVSEPYWPGPVSRSSTARGPELKRTGSNLKGSRGGRISVDSRAESIRQRMTRGSATRVRELPADPRPSESEITSEDAAIALRNASADTIQLESERRTASEPRSHRHRDVGESRRQGLGLPRLFQGPTGEERRGGHSRPAGRPTGSGAEMGLSHTGQQAGAKEPTLGAWDAVRSRSVPVTGRGVGGGGGEPTGAGTLTEADSDAEASSNMLGRDLEEWMERMWDKGMLRIQEGGKRAVLTHLSNQVRAQSHSRPANLSLDSERSGHAGAGEAPQRRDRAAARRPLAVAAPNFKEHGADNGAGLGALTGPGLRLDRASGATARGGGRRESLSLKDHFAASTSAASDPQPGQGSQTPSNFGQPGRRQANGILADSVNPSHKYAQRLLTDHTISAPSTPQDRRRNGPSARAGSTQDKTLARAQSRSYGGWAAKQDRETARAAPARRDQFVEMSELQAELVQTRRNSISPMLDSRTRLGQESRRQKSPRGVPLTKMDGSQALNGRPMARKRSMADQALDGRPEVEMTSDLGFALPSRDRDNGSVGRAARGGEWV